MDLELALRILKLRMRNRWNFARLKLETIWIQLQLWRLKLDIAILTALKRLALWIEGARDEG